MAAVPGSLMLYGARRGGEGVMSCRVLLVTRGGGDGVGGNSTAARAAFQG